MSNRLTTNGDFTATREAEPLPAMRPTEWLALELEATGYEADALAAKVAAAEAAVQVAYELGAARTAAARGKAVLARLKVREMMAKHREANDKADAKRSHAIQELAYKTEQLNAKREAIAAAKAEAVAAKQCTEAELDAREAAAKVQCVAAAKAYKAAKHVQDVVLPL